jgi:hypothetical protein
VTGPEGATLDPPCTVEAGGAVYPMVGVGNRPGLAVFDAHEQLYCLYLLGDDGVYRLDHCDRCLPGAHGERIEITTFGQLPCGHV